MFYDLLEHGQREAARHQRKFRFKHRLLSIDATTIALSLSMFDWAQYKRSKGAVKLHPWISQRQKRLLPAGSSTTAEAWCRVTLGEQRLQHTQHAATAQPAPVNLAIPRPRTLAWEIATPPFREAMHDRIGAARFAKQTRHHFHRAPHFCIGGRHDAALLVIAMPHRKRETQFASFALLRLTAEKEAVVEIRRIVATVVDHQRRGIS